MQKMETPEVSGVEYDVDTSDFESLFRELAGKLSMILAKSVDLSSDMVTVQVAESKEQSDYYDVSLRIRPPFQLLGRNVDLMLGIRLHR